MWLDSDGWKGLKKQLPVDLLAATPGWSIGGLPLTSQIPFPSFSHLFPIAPVSFRLWFIAGMVSWNPHQILRDLRASGQNSTKYQGEGPLKDFVWRFSFLWPLRGIIVFRFPYEGQNVCKSDVSKTCMIHMGTNSRSSETNFPAETSRKCWTLNQLS